MKSFAIIPARGGSKRILRKNLKNFCGKPILSYSIEAALESDIFEEVLVSTDDEEIAEFSKKMGAKVPFLRSPSFATDQAPLQQAVEECFSRLPEMAKKYESFCCLLPTAPFVTGDFLKKAKQVLCATSEVEGVLPIQKYSYPIQRALQIGKGGWVEMIYPENLLIRSQDLAASFHDAGQFYFLKTKSFINQNKLILKNMSFLQISDLAGQDIDTEEDWLLAEVKYQHFSAKSAK